MDSNKFFKGLVLAVILTASVAGFSQNTQKHRLNSSITGNTKTVYFYDENGTNTYDIVYKWNNATNQWEASLKHENIYDSNGNLTTYLSYSWSPPWAITWKYDYKYDAYGNRIAKESYKYDGFDVWNPQQKEEYMYDDKGNVIVMIVYGTTCSGATCGFETFGINYQYEYTYDNKGNIIESIYDWSHKYEYTYDSLGNKIGEIYYHRYTANTWNKMEKTEYIYNLSYSKTDLILPIDYEHNSMLTEKRKYAWNSGKLDWTPSDTTTYYWSAKEMFVLKGKIICNDEPIPNVEIAYADGLFAYTNGAGEYTILLESNTTATLTPALLGYTFNPPSIMCNDVVCNLDNLDFKATGTVGIVETLHATSLQVYPNPTNKELEIESGGLTIEKVEIYSLIGALLLLENNFNEKISVSNLVAGVYLLKIYTDKGLVVRKVVKE